MEPDKLISEARARIIWGEPSSSVRDFVISNGISDMDADAKIKDFNLERNAEIRRRGIKNILIGVALIGVAGISLYLILTSSLNVRRGRGFGAVIVGGVYGIWKLVNGIIDLVRPQSEDGSISDMQE